MEWGGTTLPKSAPQTMNEVLRAMTTPAAAAYSALSAARLALLGDTFRTSKQEAALAAGVL